MYSYGRVEAILAKVQNVQPTSMGAFRGRIKHFQRLGLVPASPGKGKRIEYSLENIWIWAFALELAQFGIDPKAITRIVTVLGWAILGAFQEAGSGSEDKYFVLFPSFASKWFELEGESHGTIETKGAKAISTLGEIAGSEHRRFSTFNLSQLRREIDAAFAA